MAVTFNLITNPGTYSPARGRMNYVLNSSSSAVSDFKYIYTVNKQDVISGSISNLGYFPLPPAPVTGYGRFSVDEVINTQLTYNIQPFIHTASSASQSLIKYFLNYGYSYNIGADFVDIGTYFGSNAFLAFNIGFGPAWDIQAGDVINVQLDNLSITPQYDGIATVVSNSFPSAGYQYVEINKAYVAWPSAARTGTVDRLRRPIQATSSTYYAYNGTRQYEQTNTYNFSNNYVFYANTATVSALTNYKDGYTASFPSTRYQLETRSKKVRLTNYETLSMIFDDHSLFAIYLNTYNSNHQLLATYSYSGNFPNYQYKRYDFPVGPMNITSGWTPAVSLTNASYYTIKIGWVTGDEPPFTFHPKYMKYYEIDRSCSKFDNYRIAFLNAHGGFDYWNFNYRSTNKIAVDRNDFRKSLDWNYSIGARQDSIYGVKSTQQYTVNSDFLNRYDYAFLKELIETTEAYLVDETNELYYPIIILNNDHDDEAFELDNGFAVLTLDFKMAYDRVVQTG